MMSVNQNLVGLASGGASAPERQFDVEAIRRAFPILAERIHGRSLAYLDNAATTQKPQAVIDAVSRFYSRDNANVHRGIHYLSQRATEAYEASRARMRSFINAKTVRDIVFVRGATEAINLVAQTYGRTHVGAGDEVVVSAMEHHSNIVPWQMLCQATGARLVVAPVTDSGELLLDELARLIGPRTKLVAVTHVSNVLGTVNPVRSVTEMAHAAGARVLIDGAQAAPHLGIDVDELDCDFYAISGHKMYGPTGIGVLYGRSELLDEMPPYQGGGEMIRSVTFEKTVFRDPPAKFEAGTPNVAGAVGLAAAVDFLEGLDRKGLAAHERSLLDHASALLSAMPGVRLVGTAKQKASVLSFVVDDVHPHDVGTILDREAVAIRVGHHCAQPLMERLGFPATARASFACYNTIEEIEQLVEGLCRVREVFA